MKYPKFQMLAAALALAASTAPVCAREVKLAFETSYEAEIDRGITLLQQHDAKGAAALFSKVIAGYEQSSPAGPDYRCANNPRHAEYLAGELAKAPGDKAVVIIGPNWCLALWGKGFALIDLNRSAEAEGLLARSVEMAPSDGHYRNEYAELFKSRRDWRRSYLEFSLAWDAVSHDPKGPERRVAARSLRGMGYNKIELGELDEAERLFNQSLEFEPDNAGARSELEYIARLRASGAGQ